MELNYLHLEIKLYVSDIPWHYTPASYIYYILVARG